MERGGRRDASLMVCCQEVVLVPLHRFILIVDRCREVVAQALLMHLTCFQRVNFSHFLEGNF